MADTPNDIDAAPAPDAAPLEGGEESKRPANIQQDMKDMEKRKRVSLILNSQAFREELEEIIEEQLKSGTHPASLIALQQITEILLPHSRFNQTSMGSAPTLGRGSSCVIPIADIRGLDTQGYSKGEKVLRCKVASLYRLIDLHGWTNGIYNHISMRVSQELEHFLLNPFGLMYHEVTASSLVKVDMLGSVVDPGTTTYGPNRAGFTLHSAIHAARPDIKCVVHVHTPASTAVSAMKFGLLPISQEAVIVGEVSYYDYGGIVIDTNERDAIARALGPINKVLFLRNHGVAVCGETLEEAYYLTVLLMTAVETQVRLLQVSGGVENIVQIPEEVAKKTREVARQGSGGVSQDKASWRSGQLEFEAMMRFLDTMGHRTGYVYHQPLLLRGDTRKPLHDVAIPPASTSFTYIYDDDRQGSKYQSPIKLAQQKKAQGQKKKWLNSPNVYTKVEVVDDNTGAAKVGEEEEPKVTTKWVAGDESAKTKTTTVEITDPQQFAKQGTDPKEFKKKQKNIKQDRYEDKITAGPISDVLEGVYPAPRIQDSQSAPGENVQAGSKGIIQKDFRGEAVVYTTYTPNPFEGISQKEILQYKQEIATKTGQDLSDIDFHVETKDVQDGDIQTEETIITSESVNKEGEKVVTKKVIKKEKQHKVEKKRYGGSEVNGERGQGDATPEVEVRSGDSSKESSPTKETTSPSKKKDKKDKKSKNPFRTPSFLQKKKKNRQEKGEPEEQAE